jgi:excisionase family DNA binding protein
MKTMSVVQARDHRTILTVDEKEIAEARTMSTCLDEMRQTAAGFEIGPAGGQMVPIPSALAGLMRAVIDGVSKGATVTIHSLPRELTTTTAAKMLGISRPTLMKHIAEKKLPAHKVGSHTRVLASDVIAFRKKQREAQRRAFEELRRLDEEIGLEP